jgi:hypothetical protein
MHTLNEHTELEERCNVLRRHLYSWMEAQDSYIPLISNDYVTTSTKSSLAMSGDSLPDPETMPLKLLLKLPASI